MLTILYAMICAAIAIRLATFNRNGGDYRPIPALLAWLLTVAAGSVPLRALLASALAVHLLQWALRKAPEDLLKLRKGG